MRAQPITVVQEMWVLRARAPTLLVAVCFCADGTCCAQGGYKIEGHG